jgi:hypothetical protein
MVLWNNPDGYGCTKTILDSNQNSFLLECYRHTWLACSSRILLNKGVSLNLPLPCQKFTTSDGWFFASRRIRRILKMKTAQISLLLLTTEKKNEAKKRKLNWEFYINTFVTLWKHPTDLRNQQLWSKNGIVYQKSPCAYLSVQQLFFISVVGLLSPFYA